MAPDAAAEPLFENSGFENGTLDGWQADGNAFTNQPTEGDNPTARGRETCGHDGNHWIGTYENYTGKLGSPGATRGDEATGTLTSAEFTIAKPYLSFLIGGGKLSGEVGVKLVCEGSEHELATGHNSETMLPHCEDVSKLVGKRARIVVYDNATAGWGHINVDSFAAHDKPYVDPKGRFAFTRDIAAQAYPNTGYDQPQRPQFHFTSRKNWLNDPNGMLYDGTKYHLFFQHNPKGTEWGNMTWGHATSPDMVHWTQLDHALLPYRVDRRDGTIYSGTAVIDHNNSLGKQQGDTKTLVAFYTFENQPSFYQAMAYSTDLGETWTYWNEGRPVVENQGFDAGERDPKVFWHEESEQWVMALWVQLSNSGQGTPGRVRFFTSSNLIDWKFASDLLRDWAFECMDVVFLPLDGDSSQMKCVLYDASFDYEVGTFDGKAFQTETKHLVAGGGNFYAAQSFYNAPGGRVVQIGWMRGGPNSAQLHGLPFNQQMSFPCELTLHRTAEGMRLNANPAREIDSLVARTHLLTTTTLSPGTNLLAEYEKLDLVDLTIEFEPREAKQLVLDFAGVEMVYDADKKSIFHTGVDDQGNPRHVTTLKNVALRDGAIKLRLLVDRLSVEAYLNDGQQFSAHYYSPQHGSGKQSIHCVGGDVNVRSLTVRELKSAW